MLASDPENNAACGGGVTIDGNTLVVGCYYKDEGMTADVGAAYVFTRSGTAWSEQAKIVPSDGIARLYFGLRLSLRGHAGGRGTAASSTRGTGTGATYVYLRSGSSWSQQAARRQRYCRGSSSDRRWPWPATRCWSARPTISMAARAVRVRPMFYARSAGTWSEQQKLTTAMPIDRFYFGVAVALSGDHALVGGFYRRSTGSIASAPHGASRANRRDHRRRVSRHRRRRHWHRKRRQRLPVPFRRREESGAVYTFAGIRTKANGQTCAATSTARAASAPTVLL